MHACDECGARTPAWQGRCPRCGAWGALEPLPPDGGRKGGAGRGALVAHGRSSPPPLLLTEVSTAGVPRTTTGIGEFDRVLGGGFVPGSVVLVGGEPGVGKSTLLLRVAACVAGAATGPGAAPGAGRAAGAAGAAGALRGSRASGERGARAGAAPPVLYVTGEESPQQVARRAARIGATVDSLALLDTTDIDAIADALERHRPRLCVVDSVQSVRTRDSVGAPGGPAQVRAAAERLVPAARASGCALLLVGQVTKVGGLAGPRTLEHAVDAVVLFEGDRHTSLRALRAVKNRYGPTDEIGLFEMREDGLREVRNASDRLLADRRSEGPGSVVAAVVEGRRALCVEVQALLVGRNLHAPRRRAQGVDPRRVEVLAGVVASRIENRIADREALVNVVGGLIVQDPGIDLAVALALIGEQRGTTVDPDAVVLGEVGLRAEVRPVTQALARLKEARAMGFRRAYVPCGTPSLDGIVVVPVAVVHEIPMRWCPCADDDAPRPGKDGVPDAGAGPGAGADANASAETAVDAEAAAARTAWNGPGTARRGSGGGTAPPGAGAPS